MTDNELEQMAHRASQRMFLVMEGETNSAARVILAALKSVWDAQQQRIEALESALRKITESKATWSENDYSRNLQRIARAALNPPPESVDDMARRLW